VGQALCAVDALRTVCGRLERVSELRHLGTRLQAVQALIAPCLVRFAKLETQLKVQSDPGGVTAVEAAAQSERDLCAALEVMQDSQAGHQEELRAVQSELKALRAAAFKSLHQMERCRLSLYKLGGERKKLVGDASALAVCIADTEVGETGAVARVSSSQCGSNAFHMLL
jgi:hypothetical protein